MNYSQQIEQKKQYRPVVLEKASLQAIHHTN